MEKTNKTEQEMIDNLTDQFRKFNMELYAEDIDILSKEDVENFQNDIKDLVHDHGKNLQLAVKVKYRKGNMLKNLGENTNRKARLLTNVVKNGVKIPSDLTYFELKVNPAIIVRNTKKGKLDINPIDIDLLKITVYMGEASFKTGKVSTGRTNTLLYQKMIHLFMCGEKAHLILD